MTRRRIWFYVFLIALLMAAVLLRQSIRGRCSLWPSPGLHNITQSDTPSRSMSPVGPDSLAMDVRSSNLRSSDLRNPSRQSSVTTENKSRMLALHMESKTAIPAASGQMPESVHDSQPGLYKYPDWWEKAWPRSAVSCLKDFVGAQPLFPPCRDGRQAAKGYPYEEPRDYLPNSKNPCWYDDHKEKRDLRCAPYFYLAGVAKGGTSDLYRRIRLHPDVMRGSEKEYHWWDRGRYEHLSKEPDSKTIHIKGGVSLNEYLAEVNDPGLDEIAKDLHKHGKSIKIFGDGSPSYLWDSFYWVVLDGNQGCTEPRVITGHHIRHFYPEAKIILTFRHPTPRLYSRFLSRIPRTGYLRRATSEDFHRYVVQAVRFYRTCFEKWSIRHCAYNHTLHAESTTRLAEGMYSVFMADWLRIWPKEQMLILRYEDYAENLESVMKGVFNFLGLAPLNQTDMEFVTHREAVNVGDMYDKVGHMLPQTKEILDDFYRPFVHKFAEILSDTRFLWLDKEH